ncbi:MAG: LTA synthase family protein, partial [Elusimicrobiota bacterium]|nr:LTA synthase family protein [Elusimicrobiota bacterium]
LPQAEISSNAFLNKVGINGFYTLEDAFVVRSEENNIDYIEQSGYKDNIRQAFADFLDKDITEIPQYNPEDSLIKNLPYNKDIEDIKPNVIVIIMESFGADLIKYQSEEFNILGELKKHFDEDLVFMNFVPGHHVTIGSIEAVTTNIARKPMSPYLSQSKYIYQKYQFSGPRPYKAKGYESIFIYGGNMGWRGLEPFMLSLGFDEVLGDGAMDSKYPRNQWGIFDEYLFQYVYEALDSGEQSKFITVMTITNHPPFSLPQNYKPGSLIAPQSLNERIQNKELAQKRFETYQYANEAVGQFISKIKNSKYADNTIIVVTGDHNFWGLFQYLTQELFDSISVPFYLYIPPKLKPSNIDTAIVGSHLDILPTVYSVSLSSISYMAMGSNLLSKDAQNHIASHDSGIIFDKTDIVQYDFQNGNAAYFVWSQNSPREVLPSEERDGHKRLLKRFLSQTAISDYLIKYAGE